MFYLFKYQLFNKYSQILVFFIEQFLHKDCYIDKNNTKWKRNKV